MNRVFAAACAATCLSVSAAYAGPFVMNDASLDKVTAAGEVIFNTDIDKTVDITKTITYDVTKNVTTDVDLYGSLASAEASADSTGWDYNLAETETFAQVYDGGAQAFSDSLAAGNFFPVTPTPTPEPEPVPVP